jgi:hypothetical protein
LSIPDVVNGLFEFAGAIAGFWNVGVLLRHKQVRGFAPLAYIYFFVWGSWNCFYYPHLNQWFSLAGTIAITVSNGLFAGLAIYFSRRSHEQGK